MLSIAVCEDGILLQQTIIAKVNSYLEKNHLRGQVSGFSRSDELVSKSSSFDIVLMDIGMNGMDGMQAAKELRLQGKDCEIIFVTAFSSYVYEAFNVDASNFLVKPVSDEKLYVALNRAVKRVLKSDHSLSLIIKKGTEILKIRLCDILYCEALDHRLTIHTQSGNVAYYENIASIEQKLDENFFRCHRSYIINLKQVVACEKDTVMFSNGDRALVSRRKAGELSQKLLNTIRNEVL